MTKIEQLEATINQAQKELQELKAEQAKSVSNYWQPERTGLLWFVGISGGVSAGRNYENTKKYRVFKTQQEAEKYSEYIKAEETLREAIAIANEGWLPDWEEVTQDKHYIYLDGSELCLDYTYQLKDQPSFMYIKSQELAEKLMEEYKQEFMTYFSY